MKEVLLSAKDLCKQVGTGATRHLILDHVNLEIYDGDFTIIMGASGAGKSTLLYALSGMDELTDGQVIYKKQIISQYKEKQMALLRREAFGFVFQQSNLVSHLSLYENVVVAGYLDRGVKPKEVKAKVEALFERMHLTKAKARFPHEASGGETQRAAIARAVVNEPAILFADEPTGALNKKHSEEALDLLAQLNKQGQSVVMVTHDVHAAIRGNRILYIEDGRVLDELNLPPFKIQEAKEREVRVNEWLTSLAW